MNAEETRNLKADVVVIGSGGGTAAAVTAAEAGASVIVLEKQGVIGGNTRLAFGFWACEGPLQEREGIKTSRDEYFKIAMKWAHWHRVDPRVVRAYIDNSGGTVRWLEEKGVEFDIRSVHDRRTAHVPTGSGAGLMEAMIKAGEKLGVKTLLNTSGKRLLRGADGRINGVLAEKDGREFEIAAKSAVIATGGLTGNTELLRKYCPDFHEEMYTGKWPYHTGDGLLMAAEAGAAIPGDIPIFHVGPITKSSPRGGLANIAKDACGVWVNKLGRRFMEEGGCLFWESGNAILMQPDKLMYCVFDDGIRQNMEERGLYKAPGWGNDYQERKETGSELAKKLREMSLTQPDEVAVAGTPEELAAWMGAAPAELKATIEEYNTACDNGRDPLFAKDKAALLPLRRPPYYAIKCTTDCGETMGGIKVSARMEALNEKGAAIPGLFVAGVIADGWESQTYCCDEMAGSAYGFALTSGRIAGESAARFSLGK